MNLVPSIWVPSVFHAWENAGIHALVLRNYKSLPEDPGNDLDVLVSRGQCTAARVILKQCITRLGGVVHHHAAFACDSIFFHDPTSGRQYHVDIFDRLLWRVSPILDSESVMARRRSYQGFFVPAETDEALLNLMTRLLYGAEVRAKYHELIIRCHQTPAFLSALQHLLGARLARDTVGWIEARAWDRIETQRRRYRVAVTIRAWLRRPWAVMWQCLMDGFRLARRAIYYPGVFVTLVGPDGCGKTSAGVALRERLAGTFYLHGGLYLHWKARLINRSSNPMGTPCTDPHGKPLRSRGASLVYFLAHTAEMIVAHWIKVRPVLFRNGLVLIDRYYYDFFVDPRRYRLNIPAWLVWAVYPLVPKPDVIFFFDAAPEILQERKKEVAFEECRRQREAYWSLAQQLPQARIIDAAQPLEVVINTTLKSALDFLVGRRGR